jgi:hypothetical protein
MSEPVDRIREFEWNKGLILKRIDDASFPLDTID